MSKPEVEAFLTHAEQLTPDQRRSVLRLVTFPVRGPDALGDVLGWVAIKHFPEAIELRQMWARWITSGGFDGDPRSSADLARYVVSFYEEQVAGREQNRGGAMHSHTSQRTLWG